MTSAIAIGTVRNYRTTASKYTVSERTDNSFTVHEKFNKLEDRAERVKLVASKIWTVSEAVAYVASLNAPEPAPEPTPEPTPEPAPELSEIEKTRLHIQQLEGQLKAARAKLAKLESEEAEDEAIGSRLDRAGAHHDRPARRSPGHPDARRPPTTVRTARPARPATVTTSGPLSGTRASALPRGRLRRSPPTLPS